MMPRSPTATRRLPAAARAIRSEWAARRAASAGSSCAWAGESGAPAAALSAAAAATSAASAARRYSTASPDAAALQHARLVVLGRALDVEVVGLRLFVLQAERQVAPVGEVHDQLERRPQRRQIVVVHRMPFLDTIELAARVVAVDGEDLPGILVHVQ